MVEISDADITISAVMGFTGHSDIAYFAESI